MTSSARTRLFQIPQRYRFSSKSQLDCMSKITMLSCFRYHKGTDFQANHNIAAQCEHLPQVVLDTTKVQIFKQITTVRVPSGLCLRCFRYHKGTDFQANHNWCDKLWYWRAVVLDTTKVQIFKQITTQYCTLSATLGCFRYHKGTDFQANHNKKIANDAAERVVLDTTKVQIFKQITTFLRLICNGRQLFQIPQRYRFSSKSQLINPETKERVRCFRYHKGTDFQANHN